MRLRMMILSLLLTLLTGGPAAAAIPAGTLAGQIVGPDGQPLANGTVYFFSAAVGPPPAPERYWRVPDDLTQLDGEGRFAVQLLPGTYFVGAIKRQQGHEIGPPRDGDLFLTSRDAQGAPRPYTIMPGERHDAGVLTGVTVFRQATIKKTAITGIAGKVLAADGTPMAGALVFAFVTPTMIGRPLYVSDRTGKDGTYLLRVGDGGTYYLRVRDIYGGGVPTTGMLMGSYGGATPKPVEVKAGAVTGGIDINAAPFTRPTPGKKGPGGMKGKGGPPQP